MQVQLYLDDSGTMQMSQMMSIQTTIQGLFSQLPPLTKHLVQMVLGNPAALANDFQLRVVCDFPDIASGHSFDLDVHSSVTLAEIMCEYVPGTFQLSFRLLYRGRPVNLARLVDEALGQSQSQILEAGSPAQPQTVAAQGPAINQQSQCLPPLSAGALNAPARMVNAEGVQNAMVTDDARAERNAKQAKQVVCMITELSPHCIDTCNHCSLVKLCYVVFGSIEVAMNR